MLRGIYGDAERFRSPISMNFPGSTTQAMGRAATKTVISGSWAGSTM
jgi:hypothetical protein